jgi:hypothetical protein
VLGCRDSDSDSAGRDDDGDGTVVAAQEINTLTTHWNTAQQLKETAMATNAPAATMACMLATLFL